VVEALTAGEGQPPAGVSQEVKHVDYCRLLASRLVRFLAVVNQILLLGIDADDRPPTAAQAAFWVVSQIC
jgi:hypothetical protein